MKTDVEELSPTRVKLTIEVPFDELRPSLDKAYREVAKQVRVPGFRPGRVPPRIIDQRVGRGAVLQQAVNEAMPELYGQALAAKEVFALGTNCPNVPREFDVYVRLVTTMSATSPCNSSDPSEPALCIVMPTTSFSATTCCGATTSFTAAKMPDSGV